MEDIPWGMKIVEFTGALIDDEEAERRARAGGASAIMELGDGMNIDGFDKGGIAAKINHGVAPPTVPPPRQGKNLDRRRRRRGHEGRRTHIRLRDRLLSRDDIGNALRRELLATRPDWSSQPSLTKGWRNALRRGLALATADTGSSG